MRKQFKDACYQEVDGFYYLDTSKLQGIVSQSDVKQIANYLSDKNRRWEKQVNKAFANIPSDQPETTDFDDR